MERPHAQGAAVGVPALRSPAHVAQQHPKARFYVGVFVILFVVTALEVAVTYFPAIPQLPALLSLAAIKFFLIAAFYMHLRFDSRLFSALFIVGLLIAMGMLFSFMGLFTAHYREPFIPTLEHAEESASGTPAAGASSTTGTSR
jgi:caa(3)-type oxidase subunit IV